MDRRWGAFVVVAAIVLVALPARTAGGAQNELVSALRDHAATITLVDGQIGGDGGRVLLEAAGAAQFLLLAEEHNLAELNELTAALWNELSTESGYGYLALEQGSVIGRWMCEAARREGPEAVRALVGRYPHAPTFATDEELALISRVCQSSSAPTMPVWGVDQELGAMHLLERLADLAPDEAAEGRLRSLAEAARPHEADRFGEVHYLAQVATPADFADLPELMNAAPGSEAAELIDALQRTTRIYNNYTRAVAGEATAYENSREREHSMKLRFLENYREALAAGVAEPRVILKAGHWHLYRGIYRGNVPTLGNFLSELAIANGNSSFSVATFSVDSPDRWRNTSGPITQAAGPGTFTLIDLRPLRPLVHQGSLGELSDTMRALFFRTDALLIVRGGRTGNYEAARSNTGS